MAVFWGLNVPPIIKIGENKNKGQIMKSYIRKSYAFKDDRMIVFNGHIKSETAIKRGFSHVTLSIFDASGKGRGENRRFSYPFATMKPFF